jgi:hypothetical protein
MVNRCSKFLHFGRKSWGEFEKPTPEVPILTTVCHLDWIKDSSKRVCVINSAQVLKFGTVLHHFSDPQIHEEL